MSDYVPNIPFAPGTPEYEQFLRAQAVPPLSVGAGALTQLMPLAADEQGNITRPGLPGMVTGGYGMIGATLPELINKGLGTNLGKLPGAEWARQQYEQASNAAQDVLPSRRLADETGNPNAQIINDVGESLGAASVPLPATAARVITNLPSVIRPIVETAIGAPTAAHVPAAMVMSPAITGAIEGSMQQPALDPNNFPDPRDIPDPRTQQVAGQGGQPTLPFDTTSQSLPTPPIPPAQAPPIQTNLAPATGTLGQQPAQVSPPTYGAEGESWTSYATGIGETLAALGMAWATAKYGGKFLINPVAKSLGAFKPDTAAVANAAIAARDAGNAPAPTTLSGRPIEAPIPAPARKSFLDPGVSAPDAPTTRLANAAYDKLRILNTAIDAYAPTPAAADALKNSLGTSENASAFGDRMHAQMATGVNMFTGTSGVAWEDIAKAVRDGMTSDQFAKADLGMHAGSELDYRKNNNGKVLNFVNTDTPTLQGYYNDMMTDPVTAQIRNMVQNAHSDTISAQVSTGRMSQADATAHLRDNPNWMPELKENGDVLGLSPPDGARPFSGWERPPTDFMNASIQAYHDAHADMLRNMVTRDIVNNAVNWQNADPTRSRVFTERTFPDPNNPGQRIPGGPGTGRTVTFYEGGKAKTYNVNSTVMYNALKRNSVQSTAALDLMNRARQGFTALTTGPLAMVGGRPFAPIQALRSTLQIPIERAAGTSAGYLDRGLQALTGGPGLRGDPTFALQVADNMFRNMGSSVAKNLSEMFSDKATPASMGARAVLGDKWTDAMSTWLNNRYENSRLFENRLAGVGRTGGMATVEPPMFLTGGQTKGGFRGEQKFSYTNPLAASYPEAFSGGKVMLPGFKRSATAQYIHLRNLLEDLHTQVAESGNAAYYQANKNNANFSPQTMARLTRSVIGDVGMTGASPTAQRLGKLIPYFNPIVQEATRMVRNFRDAPIASVTSEVGTMLALATASTMTAVMGGKDAVNYLENQMTTQQRASDATFFHDPTNYLNHTVISLPQRWRPIYPYVLEMVSTALGAWQAHDNEDNYNRLIHTTADFFNHHIQSSTNTSASHGLSSMLDISLPPAMNAVAAAFGGEFGEIPGTTIQNIRAGRPWLQGMMGENDELQRMPGQAGFTNISHNDGKWRDAVLNELGGSLVNAYHTFIGTPWQRLHEGSSMPAAIVGMGSDVLQSFRDGMPWGNLIWGNTANLNKFDPLAENVRNAMENLHNLGGVVDATTIGATGPGGQAAVPIDTNKIPDDPTMRLMYDRAVNFVPSMEPLEKQRSAISMVMEQVKSSGDSAQNKRKLLNEYTRQYADYTAEMDGRIRLLNADLSHIAGDRVVNIQKPINWHGTVDQFHP